MIRYLWEYHYNSIGTFDRFLKFDVDLVMFGLLFENLCH